MGVGTFFTSKLDEAIGWARKYSIFQYPFVTACCGMEYMATACSHYDVDRFGAGLPRFSPRQADVLFVVGTISHKMAPVLKRIYDQMCEPKWVVVTPRLCVMYMIAMPMSCCRLRIKSRICASVVTSKAVVGSSAINRLG